jgi:hypothetical protein
VASKRRVRAVVLRQRVLGVDDAALALAARGTLAVALLGALATLALWAMGDVDLRVFWLESLAEVAAVLLAARFRSRAATALLLLLLLSSAAFCVARHLPALRVAMAALGCAAALWLCWATFSAHAAAHAGGKHAPLPRPSGALPALVALLVGCAWVGVERSAALWPAAQPVGAARADAGAALTDAERRAAEQRLEHDEPELPACYTGDPAQLFVYTDARGKDVVVERITDVPHSLRKTARCAR